ncbi:MAG: hypothetical protein HXY36_06665 [Chloroflexi bacterium]|nr:hypothetical protein [Chloroflexota bacterium]
MAIWVEKIVKEFMAVRTQTKIQSEGCSITMDKGQEKGIITLLELEDYV